MILENFENLTLSIIDSYHLDVMNKIYHNILSSIRLLILNNKYIKDAGFEIYENEWLIYLKDVDSLINTMISQPFLLIPFNLDDIIEGNLII